MTRSFCHRFCAVAVTALLLSFSGALAAVTNSRTGNSDNRPLYGANEFMPTAEFRLGMNLKEVEAVIDRRFGAWKKTEQSARINYTLSKSSLFYTNNSFTYRITLKKSAPFKSEEYTLYFTSPLSNSILYWKGRTIHYTDGDVPTFNHWKSAVNSAWAEPYAITQSKNGVLRMRFFFDQNGQPVLPRAHDCDAILKSKTGKFSLSTYSAENLRLQSLVADQCISESLAMTGRLPDGSILDSFVSMGREIDYLNDMKKRLIYGSP